MPDPRSMMALNNDVARLIDGQLETWEMARANYQGLASVQSRRLLVNGWPVGIQFNPERIRSSAAKIDKLSLAARPCFLCETNRPPEQLTIDFGTEYQIVLNPYPIFPRHLTIPIRAHREQCIGSNRYTDMLSLAEVLTDYVIFYNGPRCGASAPDHMHFQAGSKGFLPVEQSWRKASAETVAVAGDAVLYALKDFLQPLFVIRSAGKEDAACLFNRLYALLPVHPGEYEPMMNLLAWQEEGKYITCIWPRRKLHPACYHAMGDANLLISPATVEMAGVFITPLEKDYWKVTTADLQSILQEVCLTAGEIDRICQLFKSDTL